MLKVISQDKLSNYCGRGKNRSLNTRLMSISGDADSIIALGKFLISCGKILNKNDQYFGHSHLRDEFVGWTKDSVDFVVHK